MEFVLLQAIVILLYHDELIIGYHNEPIIVFGQQRMSGPTWPTLMWASPQLLSTVEPACKDIPEMSTSLLIKTLCIAPAT
jgi:hypothetical protein